MKTRSDPDRAVALALTWDGARWPVKSLPPKARAFLSGRLQTGAVPPPQRFAELLARGQITELRICWIPRLKGGDHVLSAPFGTADQKRLGFKVSRVIPLGDMCGIVYRRARAV